MERAPVPKLPASLQRFVTACVALIVFEACDLSQSSSSNSGFDSWSVLGPSALLNGTTLNVWYYGTNAITSTTPDIGLATVTCAASPCVPGTLTRSGAVTSSAGSQLGEQGIASDPTVTFDGTTYRMWFTSVEENTDTAATIGTAYTTSTDGAAWETPTYNVLGASAGTFDAAGVETPNVVSVGGQFKLYYTGYGATDSLGNSHQSIGLAQSQDGVTWVKNGTSAIFDSIADWESGICANPPDCTAVAGGVGEPTVLFDSTAGLYKMWYAGLGTDGTLGTYRIGYATSSDGFSWSRQSAPVLDVGASGNWDDGGVSQPNVIQDPAGGFHLFYFGFPASATTTCSDAGGCTFIPGSIGHAFSADGITWTRDASPVLTP